MYTRRSFLVGLVATPAVLALAACGGSPPASATVGAKASGAAPPAGTAVPTAAAAAPTAAPAAKTSAGAAGTLVFLSSQFAPVEEAEKMRKVVLAGFKGKIDFVPPSDPGSFSDRINAEEKSGKVSIGVAGGLHGDFAPFAKTGYFEDLTPLLTKLQDRKFPQTLVDLSKLGTQDQHFYIPWMQATYVMMANKKALPYLPQGASQDTLTYAQLKEWGANIQKATGQRRLGFPAGPNGLIARFFEGYLYPSYTKSSGVTEFKSADAAALWAYFKDLWTEVNPQSTSFEFMQEALLSEQVWVAWDHTARLINAATQKTSDFVMFPAPAGPKGRGYMSVLGGLAILKGAPDRASDEQLITYLTEPQQQINTLKELAFFPVTGVEMPSDLPPGVKLEADAVQKQSNAADAIPELLPVGLGPKGGEFNKVYTDSFTRIVLKNEPVQQVLDDESKVLQGIIDATKAPCWAPDPVGSEPCKVK